MRTILHCDANNFYASVEQQIHPELKGIPIAVSGNPDKRHGIILAKCNIAKACGVKTGETLWQAKQKCPNIRFVPPTYSEYVKYSDKIFDIYTEYTDMVEPFGIDECWLDCSGSLRLFDSGENIANLLRERVKADLGITISVGVSFTKVFAKLGSDIKKPDATTVITQDNFKQIVWPLPVTDLLMVGRKTDALFQRLSIRTIGDLANYNLNALKMHLGINAEKLNAYANGVEIEDVRYHYNKHIPKSVGNSITLPIDIVEKSEAQAVIVGLAEMVATRLRKYGLQALGVGLHIKYNNLKGNSKNTLIDVPTNNAKAIYEQAINILHNNYNFDNDLPIRALGVYTYKLTNENDCYQTNMFALSHEKDDEIESSVDIIRKKYGYESLKKGIVLRHSKLCDDLVDDDFLPFKK